MISCRWLILHAHARGSSHGRQFLYPLFLFPFVNIMYFFDRVMMVDKVGT